jgi:hypothetical protein
MVVALASKARDRAQMIRAGLTVRDGRRKDQDR